MEINEKLRDLLNSETFANEIKNLKTVEELQVVLKQHGVEMTTDEIIELGGHLARKVGMDKNGELTEEDLENVSGGGLLALAALGIASICFGAYMGYFSE